jgi:hypothetical protein
MRTHSHQLQLKDQREKNNLSGITYNKNTRKFIIRCKNTKRNKGIVPYVTVAQFNTIEEAEKYCKEYEI